MTAASAAAPRTPELLAGTVLVVDDDEGMRDTVVEILGSAGINAVGVASATDAEQRQRETRPSVALVDQRLPDASGIDLGGRLKADDEDLTVVLITGHASLQDAIAAVWELDGFLTKPVPPPELLRVVTTGLERARLRRENRGLVGELESSVTARMNELTGLQRLSAALAEATELQDVADACVRIALDATGAGAAGLYLRDEGRIAPRLAARAGDEPLPAELSPQQADGRVVSLTAGGREIGALALQGAVRAQPMFLTTFAGVAAVAIQNAQRLSLEQEAVERLSELSRMKSTLLATVSHELRTPMTTVVGFADLLGRQFDVASREEQREMLDLIIEQGQHLKVLVEDLVDASRVEFGTLHVQTGAVDAREVAERVARSLADREHPIRLRLPPELPAVHADDRRLQQVLTNLVTNGMKHSEPGSAVDVEAVADDECVTFSVVDRGKGIDPDFLPQIFEPFAQEQRGGRGTGLGLGLYIVRGLVEAMSGRIEAHSVLGEGSRFVVHLRRAA